MGFSTSDIHKALGHLLSLDSHTVIKAAHDLTKANSFKYKNTLKGPCVEKELEGIDNFITKHPRDVVTSKVRITPIIIGHNDNEAAVELSCFKS